MKEFRKCICNEDCWPFLKDFFKNRQGWGYVGSPAGPEPDQVTNIRQWLTVQTGRHKQSFIECKALLTGYAVEIDYRCSEAPIS